MNRIAKFKSISEFIEEEIQLKKKTTKNLVVVGAQWGDEGKGRIIDLLSEKFDALVGAPQ